MPRYESPYDPATMPRNLEHVRYEKKGHVAYVTINRPEVRNALHSYSYAELRLCWRDMGLDPDIYVGIVTGAGEAFCAGRDVKFLAKYQAQGKRTPHEDPDQPDVSLGRRRAAERRQPGEAAHRRHQRLRRGGRAQPRAAVPAAGDGGGRLDRRHPHEGREARHGAQPVRIPAPRDRRLPHALQRAAGRRAVPAARHRQPGGAEGEADPGRRGAGRDGLRGLAAGDPGGRPALSPERRVPGRADRLCAPSRPGDRGERGRRRRPAGVPARSASPAGRSGSKLSAWPLRGSDAAPGAAVGRRHRRLRPRRQPGRPRRRLPAEVRLPRDRSGRSMPGATWSATLPCYPSLAALPAVPDQAIIAVPAESVVPVVQDCIAAGVPAAVVWAGGFAETDAAGRARQRELEDVCRGTGLKLCGPNCIGIINTAIGLTASFSSLMTEVDRFTPGAVSIVSQSGGIAVTAHARAQELGFGFRVTISCGNEAVLGIPDFVRALAQDDATRVIAVYTEGLSDPAGFVEALAEARRCGKPVVVLKGGATEASGRAALAHTGRLVGLDRTYDAIFREFAAIRVYSSEEMLDVCLQLASLRPGQLPAGNRVLLSSFGGGSGVLGTDQCAREGLAVPPLDPDTRRQVAPLLRRSPRRSTRSISRRDR